MQNIIAKNEEIVNPQKNYKYQTIHYYESISGKQKDIRVKKETEEEYRKLARSGIPAWLILDRVLRVINRHPEIREEILKEDEE
jgi:hypothetical protein